MQDSIRTATALVTPPLSTHVDAPWFARLVADTQRPWHLLALPQAGAGCATLAECANALEPDIATFGLNLPGRQARYREPPIADLAELIDKVTAGMKSYVNQPYVLFGYCSGALLAYLIATAARAAGLPAPKALVVASYPAPQHADPPRELHRLPSDAFWQEILSQGGFDPVLVAQHEHRDIFEPALRADYQVLSTYHYEPALPLDVPIVALAGSRDPSLDERALAAWSEQTKAAFHYRLLDGDHWLLERSTAEIARVLERECRR